MTLLSLITFIIFPACSQNTLTEVREKDKIVATEEHSYFEPVSFPKRPIKNGNWASPPAVFVCSGTPITEVRIENAMDFWRRQGYELVGPFMNSNLSACRGEDNFSWGNIIVDLRGQSFPFGKLALTTTYRKTSDNTIVGAVIKIQGFTSEKERTIEHEIGHAFGWKHFNRKYHMMNEAYELGGWDSFGLKNIK